MYSDEDLVVQLRQAFDASTQSISTAPELAAVIRSQFRRRRTARVAGAGVSTAAVCGLVLGVSLPGGSNSPIDTSTPTVSPDSSVAGQATATPLKLASVSTVLDAASTAKPAFVGRAEYLHTRVTTYGLSGIVGQRVVGYFSTNVNDSWVPSDPKQLSLQKASYNETVTYLNPADRAYLEGQAPGGAPARDTEWFATKSDDTTFQIYPTFGAGAPKAVVSPGPETTPDPWTDSSYQASLPRNPIALRVSLYAHATAEAAEATGAGAGKSYSADDAAFDAVAAALAWPNISADLRVELYQVAKTIPGIKLVGATVNYNGAPGFAIGRVWQAAGIEQELIFDVHTSEYIGDRSITVRATDQYPGVEGQPTLPAGTLISATAISVDVTSEPALPPGVKLP